MDSEKVYHSIMSLSFMFSAARNKLVIKICCLHLNYLSKSNSSKFIEFLFMHKDKTFVKQDIGCWKLPSIPQGNIKITHQYTIYIIIVIIMVLLYVDAKTYYHAAILSEYMEAQTCRNKYTFLYLLNLSLFQLGLHWHLNKQKCNSSNMKEYVSKPIH
jgi:hypothetical protein